MIAEPLVIKTNWVLSETLASVQIQTEMIQKCVELKGMKAVKVRSKHIAPSIPNSPPVQHSLTSSTVLLLMQKEKRNQNIYFFGPTLTIKFKTLQSLDNHSDPF